MSNDQRITWLDCARGIGIILVVIGHVERGLVAAHLGPELRAFDTPLYTFHMPLFMLLAGLNVPASLARGRERFITQKARTIAYPYLLWSILQGVILVELSGSTNGKAHWSDLDQILWRPMSQFWFLYALFLFMVFIAGVGCRVGLLMTLAVCGCLLSSNLYDQPVLQELTFYFLPFVAGMALAKWLTSWNPRYPALIGVAAAAAWFGSLYLLPSRVERAYMLPAALPAALFGVLACLAAARAMAGRALDWLAWVGALSMPIYLMHVMAAAGIRIVMMRLHLQLGPDLYLLVGSVVGVGAPIIVYLLLKRAGMLFLFGLGAKRKFGNGSAAPALP